ncbi:MAG TPA: hypothetical protein VMV18_06065, partial [bacterium]|nr:hypothetical protein [bacterium]
MKARVLVMWGFVVGAGALAAGPRAIAARRATAQAPAQAGAQAPARKDAAADAALVARGAELLASSECARCHAGTGIPELEPMPIGQSCTGCHAWVRDASRAPEESARQRARYPLWDRYESRVKDFVAVPDLAASGARLDPEWVARYVRAPYHVRPGLREAMIRTALTD